MANPRSRGNASPTRRSRLDKLPTLPAWKAFVVQFTRETGVEPRTFCGRVEHLSSGQSSRFASAGGLIEFVQAVLQQRVPAPRWSRRASPTHGEDEQ